MIFPTLLSDQRLLASKVWAESPRVVDNSTLVSDQRLLASKVWADEIGARIRTTAIVINAYWHLRFGQLLQRQNELPETSDQRLLASKVWAVY